MHLLLWKLTYCFATRLGEVSLSREDTMLIEPEIMLNRHLPSETGLKQGSAILQQANQYTTPSTVLPDISRRFVRSFSTPASKYRFSQQIDRLMGLFILLPIRPLPNSLIYMRYIKVGGSAR